MIRTSAKIWLCDERVSTGSGGAAVEGTRTVFSSLHKS